MLSLKYWIADKPFVISPIKTCKDDMKNHVVHDDFWEAYNSLPRNVQRSTLRKIELLLENPRHPSLYLKKVGRLWSARINKQYRILAREKEGTLVWYWVGKHDEYMRQIWCVSVESPVFILPPLKEAQANNLCYKCEYIFRFHYKIDTYHAVSNLNSITENEIYN